METSASITAVTAERAAGPPLAPNQLPQQRGLVQRWVVWLDEQVEQAQLSAATVAMYRHAAKVWLQFLAEVARTDEPSTATVAAFMAALLPGRKPGSVNTIVSAIKAMFRWAATAGVGEDIGRPIRAVRVRRDGPLPALKRAQVVDLLALVEGDGLCALRDRAIVGLLFGSGVRTVSLHRCDVRHYDPAAATIKHQAKGRRDADSVAYLPPSAAAALSAYLTARARHEEVRPDSPLLATCDRATFGKRASTKAIRNVVIRLLERAGHRRRGVDGKLVAPNTWAAHAIRRSALTAVADQHGLEAARAVAGHASVETTRRSYVRTKLDGQLRAVAATLDLAAPRQPASCTPACTPGGSTE